MTRRALSSLAIGGPMGDKLAKYGTALIAALFAVAVSASINLPEFIAGWFGCMIFYTVLEPGKTEKGAD